MGRTSKRSDERDLLLSGVRPPSRTPEGEDAHGQNNEQRNDLHAYPAIRIEIRSADPHEPLPKRRRVPRLLPPTAPLPRVGEVIYVNSTSAWRVATITHEWLAPDDLLIALWLEHIGRTHYAERPAFVATQ